MTFEEAAQLFYGAPLITTESHRDRNSGEVLQKTITCEFVKTIGRHVLVKTAWSGTNYISLTPEELDHA